MSDMPRAAIHPLQNGAGLGLIALLGAGAAATVIASDPAAGWGGVLIAGFFGITIALGGALFAAIFAATGATWWKPLRRMPLDVANTLPVPALAIILFVGLGVAAVYPWADPEVVHHNHLIHGKTAWLNRTFFSARAVVVLLIWWGFVTSLRRRLLAGEALARTGIFFLVVFALTISVATWDWVMSIEPEWYSTMHAVYAFAGALQVGIACTALWALRQRRLLGREFGTHQVHTLSSLLFGFSFFWGYIWFCQGMLIWYANIPEETAHYAARMEGGWSMLFWLNPVVNLAVPFIALMSTRAKRSPAALSQVAMIVVLGHFLDVVLLVGPGLGDASVQLCVAVLGAGAAVAAGMIYAIRRSARPA